VNSNLFRAQTNPVQGFEDLAVECVRNLQSTETVVRLNGEKGKSERRRELDGGSGVISESSIFEKSNFIAIPA